MLSASQIGWMWGRTAMRAIVLSLTVSGFLVLPATATEPQEGDPQANAKPTGLVPKTLKFWMGQGVSGWHYTIEWDGKELQYRQTRFGKVEVKKTVIPSEDQWKQFWQSVTEADVWNWKAAYNNPRIRDACVWELAIEYGDKKQQTRGAGGSPKSYGQFHKALGVLLGFTPG
jgi:hypothetical protein